MLLLVSKDCLGGLLHFDVLKAESKVPLEVELALTVLVEECVSEELVSPLRSVVPGDCIPRITQVLVHYQALVVHGPSESPDRIFVQLVINGWRIGVGRIGENRLSLDVQEHELLIIILEREDRALSHNSARLSLVLLESLEVIGLEHGHIVHIIMELWVLLDRLVESNEGVVEGGVDCSACQHLIERHLST